MRLPKYLDIRAITVETGRIKEALCSLGFCIQQWLRENFVGNLYPTLHFYNCYIEQIKSNEETSTVSQGELTGQAAWNNFKNV